MITNFFSSIAKYILFLLIILVSFAILHGRLKHVTDEPVMTLAPWALSVAKATVGSVSEGFPALGEVQSASEVRITPQISGTILALGPRAGGHVAKGDILVHIDTQELEANRDALRANLASAEAIAQNDSKELQREQRLFKEGGSAQSIVDQWQTKVREDRANLHSLQKQISQIDVKIGYGHIQSPLAANIAQRLAEVGDTAIPGKILYVLTSQHGGRVVVPVPLETLTHIKPGGEVQIRHGSENMTATITRINPALDNMAMGSVEIDLPKRVFDLPDGAPVAVRVISNKVNNTVIVPHSALVPSSAKTARHLFKINNSSKGAQLTKIEVSVHLCGIEGCAVEGDIQADDLVVVGHGSILLKLREGDTVNVRNIAGTTL
jgi:RND family efflux transporter MFP subunit